MFQEILTWIIVGACIVIAVTMLVRRLRGRGKSCNCGCGTGTTPGTDSSCTPSTDVCAGCAIADLCRKPEKK